MVKIGARRINIGCQKINMYLRIINFLLSPTKNLSISEKAWRKQEHKFDQKLPNLLKMHIFLKETLDREPKIRKHLKKYLKFGKT